MDLRSLEKAPPQGKEENTCTSVDNRTDERLPSEVPDSVPCLSLS